MDTPLCQLPPAVVRCLTGPGLCGLGRALVQPTAACDALMRQFCADPVYGRQSYCACLNSRLPCAGFTDPACAGAPLAYRSTAQAPGGADFAYCAARPVCLQAVDLSSAADVDRVAQVCTATPEAAAAAAKTAAAILEAAAAAPPRPVEKNHSSHLVIAIVLLVAALAALVAAAAAGSSRGSARIGAGPRRGGVRGPVIA
jgi:hypothetical protein